MRVGVLALQGDFEKHLAALARAGAEAFEVRQTRHLERADALVIPGGESTTMAKLMAEFGLWDAVRDRHAGGMAIFGTCAGAILCGRPADERPPRLGLADVEVARNAYGRQKESFRRPVAVPALGEPPVEAVFIRAPRLRAVGKGVEVLARDSGDPVLVRDGRVLLATFHPELTDDLRVHRYFLERVVEPAHALAPARLG